MAKFKVGDKVYIRRNAARSRNDILGRNKPGARVSVELRTRPIVGKVLQYGGRPIVEYSPTTRTRFTGTLIKQNGYKWDIKSDSGEIYKDVSEADFDLIDSSNAVRSTNAVIAKALNAAARNANFRGSAWDRALAVSVRPKFSKGNRVKVVGHPMEDGVRGIVEKTFPSGQVLITTGYDKDGHPYTVQVHQSYLVRNSVVQKALNAAACNAKFRVFLDNGRETEIVATSESSASDKVLQKFKFRGDKAPKVSRVVRLKPVVSGRFVGKANGLEYYVDYTDDLGFAKKYGKDGTNVTEIHINTPYLKDEDGRERRHIVYTWSRGSEWIGDKFKHPDFPDAARAARDLAAKLIRSNPNVAKIGDDTNDWR